MAGPDKPLVARRPTIIKAAVIGYDTLAAAAAMWIGVSARYALSPTLQPREDLAFSAALLFMAACLIVFPLQGLHRRVWRFTAFNDVIGIAWAVILANLVFLVALFFINRLAGLPRTSLLIEAPLLCALLLGARFARQIYASGDWRSLIRLEDRKKPAAILAGRSDTLDACLRDWKRRPSGLPLRIRGLASPEPADKGRSIRGHPVLGGAAATERALISLASANGIRPQLVVVGPGLSPAEIDDFARAAQIAGADLVRAGVEPGRAALSPLDAADLLSRPPRMLDMARVRDLVTGKSVLITGAGGTIGSELTRQIAGLGPAALTLFDASEFNLYQIDLELADNGFGHLARTVLGDVRDENRVRRMMDAARPDFVLHAAALKHVPLMENHPSEAVLTNVLGTVNVATAAREAGAQRFVLVSTDKAVNPSNVMGASKRAAEMFVQALDHEGGAMRAVSVRFGNVLGSAGSVVPLFERQIARGGPLTITHPEITRYFMTVEEASSLVLQTAALAEVFQERGGGVFVLDMGEPVLIENLARQLCRLRGLEPDKDIALVHSGLRPGEKVHEDLFYDSETVHSTEADGVLAARADLTPMVDLRPRLITLIDAARARDREAVLASLALLAPAFANRGA